MEKSVLSARSPDFSRDQNDRKGESGYPQAFGDYYLLSLDKLNLTPHNRHT